MYRRSNSDQHLINRNIVSGGRFGKAGGVKGRDGFTGLNLIFWQDTSIGNHILRATFQIFQRLRHATRRISRAQQITLCSMPGFWPRQVLLNRHAALSPLRAAASLPDCCS